MTFRTRPAPSVTVTGAPTAPLRLLLADRDDRATDRLSELSPREREILGLMAEGRSNAGISAQLYLSPRTVETHVRTIFRKLDLEDVHTDHRRVLAVIAYLQAVHVASWSYAA